MEKKIIEMKLLQRIQSVTEMHIFGVCTSLAEKIGISIGGIRLFFIYSSFLTIGSPVIIYLVLAFLKNIRKQMRNRRKSVYEI